MGTRSQQRSKETDLAGCEASLSDARLVEHARRGDKDAFGELVVRYERRLIRVIYRFVQDRELARDLAQETFLRVYERLESFDTSRRFGPWLFRVGVNLTLDYLRKVKRRRRRALVTCSLDSVDTDPPSPDPRQAADIQQEVRAVIQMLPETYRTVLILRDLENFSTAEVAAILNRKEATIRWRLAEARMRFMRLWAGRAELAAVDVPTDGAPADSSDVSEEGAAS